MRKLFEVQTSSSVTTDLSINKQLPPADHTLSKTEQKSAQESSPAISFYPDLVEHLVIDHQHLLGLYTHMGETLKRDKYHYVVNLLKTFKQDLKAHLDAENIKFYGYLEQSLKGKNSEFQAMRNFRKEMRTIERTVIKFLDKWIANGIQADTAEHFKAEYDVIGTALIKRIENEEKELYVLYDKI